ncbi:hypothetical protein EDD11_000732 [Mortierella claussenii]|nr:hypothetical protein EDD11_000732 [Mortierella claussenii]
MKSSFFSSTIAFLALGTASLSAFSEAIVLDQCTLSLATLLSDPGLNTCLPLQQLSQLLTESTVTPQLVNSTATTFCSYPVCAPASIKLVENTVTQNCVNASDPDTADLVYGAASLYVPAKEGFCQRVSPSNGTFCVTVLTESLTAYLQQHPSPLGIKIFSNATVLKQYVDSMPNEILCTPCNKAIINPLDNYIAQNQNTLNAQILKWTKVIQTEVQLKCGADFINGATPSPAPSSTTAGGSGGKNAAGLSAHESSSLITVLLGAVLSAVALAL